MPTHMRSRFDVSELACWEPAPPFAFTKGLRTMRVPVTAAFINPWLHGTLLFDLHADPGQEHPLVDDEIELRMLRLLARLMHDSDAPPSQFQRLGIPCDRDPTTADLLVRAQRAQAEATAEPVPPLSALPAAGLLTTPLLELLLDHSARSVLQRHLPQLTSTELVSLPAHLSLYDLTRMAVIPAATLLSAAKDLAARDTGNPAIPSPAPAPPQD